MYSAVDFEVRHLPQDRLRVRWYRHAMLDGTAHNCCPAMDKVDTKTTLSACVLFLVQAFCIRC